MGFYGEKKIERLLKFTQKSIQDDKTTLTKEYKVRGLRLWVSSFMKMYNNQDCSIDIRVNILVEQSKVYRHRPTCIDSKDCNQSANWM